jgi:cell division protein FtsW
VLWVAGLGGSLAGLAAAYLSFSRCAPASKIPALHPATASHRSGLVIPARRLVRPRARRSTVKRILPSHTFRLRGRAEEFGIALCLLLVAVFGFIVVRSLRRAMANEDRSRALLSLALRSCSGCNQRSTWR